MEMTKLPHTDLPGTVLMRPVAVKETINDAHRQAKADN
jgi:hypothetical protein